MPVSCRQGRSAVFLDRDGTIIEDRGCLREPAEAVFLPGAIAALQQLRGEYLLFIVTNQPGVAEGSLSAREVEMVNAHVVAELASAGVPITAVYYCPHGPQDGCACRKPKPLFLQQAAAQYGVCLGQSFVVGDHPSDVELARNAGATGVYVLTGHGGQHVHQLPPDYNVKADLAAAADFIQTRQEMSEAP